jgi:hypothetical protein
MRRIVVCLLAGLMLTAGCAKKPEAAKPDAERKSGGGVEISAPGVNIKTKNGGAEVSAPGVEVKTK